MQCKLFVPNHILILMPDVEMFQSLCGSSPGVCNECADVIHMQPRQTVLTAAGSIGQASGDLLRHMGEGETDEKFQVGHHPLTVSMTEAAKQEDTHTYSQALFVNVNTWLCNYPQL